MIKGLSLDELRAELARQDVEFEQARSILERADENTFVASESVDELRAAVARITPAPAAQGHFIRF